MSRSRRRGRTDINPFDSSAQVSLEETANAIYGSEFANIDAGRQVVRPISIFDILPDFTQPRRVIPSLIRSGWSGNPYDLKELFEVWINSVEHERGSSFDVLAILEQAYLEAEADEVENVAADDTLPLSPPIEEALRQIIELAANIRQHGLTNPISVAHDGSQYRIETGERRWLAYHLLNIYYPDEQWTRIPARVVDGVNVWRQASENSARADLNAIGKVRQFAILLMDLYRQQGYEFRSFESVLAEGLSERAYYAQVADGKQFRVPRGEGEHLLNAMGLKHPVQLRQYRALLDLSDEDWQRADDLNLPEYKIRTRDRDTVTTVTVSSPDTPERAHNPFVEKINQQRRNKVWFYANRLGVLKPDEKSAALKAIEEDLRWLDELKRALQDDET